MYSAISALCGAMVAVMIAMNGALSEAIGNYHATALIHLIGLCAIMLVLVIRRERLHPGKRLALYMYTGGVVGVVTVVATNIAFNALGASVSLALCLAGQLGVSLALDRFGLMGASRRRIGRGRLLSALAVVAGVALMMME